MIVKSRPTIKPDGKGWLRIGHEVIYKGRIYFVFLMQTKGQEEVEINVMKKSEGEPAVTKSYYQIKDIFNVTGTREDFVKFIEYNFVNWIIE